MLLVVYGYNLNMHHVTSAPDSVAHGVPQWFQNGCYLLMISDAIRVPAKHAMHTS